MKRLTGSDRLWRCLFAAALRLHPRTFRENAEAEMLRAFEDGLRRRSGRGRRWWWAAREVADLGRNLVMVWVERWAGRQKTRAHSPVRPPEGFTQGLLDGIGQDVRSALRAIVRRPGFSVFVAGTLALGIGANTAVFSVLYSILLAPLPYEEPGRLVRMYWTEPGEEPGYMNDPAFLDFREHLTSLDVAAIFDYRSTGADIVVDARPERVRVLPVSAGYFDVLRAEFLAGGAFSRDAERDGSPVVVISARLWRRAMQGDPAAVGRDLALDDVRHRVVGIVAADFVDPLHGAIDVWRPQTMQYASWAWQNDRLTVIGRLAPGVTLARARAEVARRSEVQMQLEETPLDEAWGVVVPLQDDLVGSAEPMLLVLMGAVGLLLLITCANIGALVLARGVARSREFSIRAALGSGRGRLVRQLMIESAVLAVIGASAGLVAGAIVQSGLVAVARAALPQAIVVGYGWPMALFAGALALLVVLIVGGLPALQVTRSRLEAGVRSETRSGLERVEHQRIRKALVVAEVSLAVVLLVGAGLLLTSFHRLRSRDLGVDAENVWTFQVHLPDGRYGEPRERVRFHASLHERLRAIPGVENVGAASRLPATGSYHPWGTRVEGSGSPLSDAQHRVIQGEWFDALDVGLLEGRLFGAADGPDQPRRAVVSASLAKRLFPEASAVGRRILALDDPLEIIGVVEDVASSPRGQPAPTIYHAHEQFADNRNWPLFQVVETSGPLPGLIPSARAVISALDPTLVLVEPQPFAVVLGRASARERFASLLLSVFAGLAISLAALGVYGILAYDVSRSRHEIGVRMALGAGRPEVRAMVVRRGMALMALGVVAGTVGALALSRAMTSLLFEVSPNDPRVVGSAALLVLAIGAAASWIPALRATAIEPAEAFRGR